MALHGTIEINDQLIGNWQARRTELAIHPDGNTYYCTITLNGGRFRFQVQHRFADGAAMLISKMMAAVYDEQMRVR